MAYWLIPAALGVYGGMMQASAYRSASSAERRESRRQAAEIRREKYDIALIANEAHRNRMEQFTELAAYNEAQNAYMGRTGRSIAALRKREENIYGREVTNLRLQEAREKENIERKAAAVEQRGISAAKQFESKARQSLFQTAYNTATLAIPRK